MPRCRGAASRGQVLLLRLLLVCALVAAARQEGEFTRENVPSPPENVRRSPNVILKHPRLLRVPLVRARWDYSDTREPFMDTLLGEREGYVFIWGGHE